MYCQHLTRTSLVFVDNRGTWLARSTAARIAAAYNPTPLSRKCTSQPRGVAERGDETAARIVRWEEPGADQWPQCVIWLTAGVR